MYRNDEDLEFLETVDSNSLNDLVWVLTHNKDGNERLTEGLTLKDSYKKFYPDHNKYWQDIAAEVQCFGANTFATLLRGGKGVLYREVLFDVCDRVKVNYNKSSSTERIEDGLFMKILDDSIEKMSPAELKELCEELGIKNTSGITPEAAIVACQELFSLGGFRSYQLAVIVVNAVWRALFGHGLTLLGNATLTRVLSILTGPIGWVLNGIWTAIDIAGPAYRITIPAVLQVAMLRKNQKMKNEGNYQPKDDNEID